MGGRKVFCKWLIDKCVVEHIFSKKACAGTEGTHYYYICVHASEYARARKGVTRIRTLRAVTLRGKGAYGVGEKGHAQGLQGAAAILLTRLREG